MKRTPLCALVLALLCAVARADPQYPTWPKDQVEKASDWKMISFQDDGKAHRLFCRVKECTGPLFVLTRSKADAPEGWWATGGARGFFTATLSHYSLADGKIVRDDGHPGPALDLKKDLSDIDWRRYTSLIVAAPTAMANDGAPAGTGTTQQRPTPTPTPKPSPLPTDLDAALKDYSPIERAIIKKIAKPKELEEIAAGTSKKKWKDEALNAARHDTDVPANHPLRDYLNTQSFTDKQVADYTCAGLDLGSAAAGGDKTAMPQLQTAASRSRTAASSTNIETSRAVGDITLTAVAYPNLRQYCQDAANAAKVVEQQKPGGPQQSLSVLPPPAPGGVAPGGRNDPVPSAPAASTKKDDDGNKKDKLTDTLFKGALGGMAGGFGGLIVASLLGLGPLGVFGLAIGGVLAGAFLATNHMPKKDKGGGS